MIERNQYLSKLISVKNNGFPKIITGIRRCGKSYLLKEIFKKHLIENYKNVKCEVKAISNGIKLEDYQYDANNVEEFKKMFAIKEGEKVVIGVGFYFKRKGIDDFFKVAESMKDVKFIWFGYLNKFLTTSYILKCIKNKPDNVILPGYIKGNIIKGAMYYASAMTFPVFAGSKYLLAEQSVLFRL